MITGPGCSTVMIGGLPAAVAGDICICNGPPNAIAGGSSTVLIGGKPAARQGDATVHGGKIVTGCATVFIGGIKTINESTENEEITLIMIDEYREGVLNGAIHLGIELLKRKWKLLRDSDPKTMEGFKKWFGKEDDNSRLIIQNRIRNAIKIFKRIALKNFKPIIDEDDREKYLAEVIPNDKHYTIHLGDKFWDDDLKGIDRAGILIHEISHFDDVGQTDDFTYTRDYCALLAKNDPDYALNNADSFQFFMEDE